MKILFAQTNYSAFLKSFYSKYPGWNKIGYKKLMSLWKNELFATSGLYAHAFNKLGWNANEIIINDWNSQSTWAGEHNFEVDNLRDKVLRKIPFPIKTRLGIMDDWIFKIFLKQVEVLKPDVVYSHHLGLFKEDELNEIKKRTKLLVGQIASPLPPKDYLMQFDLIVSSFPHYVKRFKKAGINSEYLAWCAEKSIPKKIGKHNKVYDVSCVGAFTPHHSKGNKILETLARQVKVNFWGYGENTLLPTSAIRRNFHGQVWGRKVYEIFAKSKIVLNRHINIAESYANNIRMFETTLMGSLLITDHKQNMNEFFEVGKEVVTYKSADDLIKKVNYYLKHPRERENIAKAGQKRTLKDHTYEVRMKELDHILRKYL